MSDSPLVQAFRIVKLFKDLTDQDLDWLAAHCEERRFEPGEFLFNAGDPAEHMSIMLEGEIEARAEDRVLFTAGAGEITGKLPYSRLQVFPRAARALSRVRLALVHQRDFAEMLDAIPALEVPLIRLMADRIREFTTSEVQQSKLAALGKLAAGLAHELNNPASAAANASLSIRQKLDQMRQLDCTIVSAELSAAQRSRLITIQSNALDHARGCTALDSLTRSDREEALGSQLTAMGVEDAWDLAPELMDAGFDEELLRDLASVSGDVMTSVLARIAILISMDRLAEEIHESTTRISKLVQSIKEYSYMDTAAQRDVDIHKDLENTLRILASKLEKRGVTIERDYDKELPKICANGSELNQVWTNLIDNAADAMAGQTSQRVLRIRTGRQLERVLVEIIDSGPGVPDSIRERIFEPFFTTKKQGEGTGLGLDAVLRIVRRHHGDISLETAPGRTCFQVLLPIKYTPSE